MKLAVHTFRLEFDEPFTISRGARDYVDSMIVVISDGQYTGYGEATANPYYHTTIRQMVETVEKLRPMIEALPEMSPDAFWNELHPHLSGQPFVLCALDQAMHDLAARKAGKPLYTQLGLKKEKLPLTNYTIGIASIDEMIEKIKAQPWPIYKVKLGTEHDMEIIKALRQHTDALFRIDANCAWTAEETITRAPILKELGVEMIEQPLKADDWEGMKQVVKNSVLPVFADESCCVESDVERCVGHFHGINIKLMKCGGVTPALRMIKKARSYGLKVMVGCMTESSVGISAIAHLLPLLDYVDMDGALLVNNDPARGVRIEAGKVFYAEENGTGAQLKIN